MKTPMILGKIRTLVAGRLAFKVSLALLGSFLLIALVTFILIHRLNQELKETSLKSLRVKTNWAASACFDQMRSFDLPHIQKYLVQKCSESFLDDPDILYLAVYDQRGKLIHAAFVEGLNYDDFRFAPLPEGPELKTTRLESASGVQVIEVAGRRELREIRSPSAEPDQIRSRPEDRHRYLRVGFSTAGMHEMSERLARLGWLLMFLLAAFCAGIVWLFNRLFTRPVLTLARQARSVGRGSWDIELPRFGDDELGALAASLQDMLSSIRSQLERGQKMVSSIAETVELLAKTTGNIYAISAQQSSGATEQAASVYEASSTSKEIAASATRITETAEEVSRFARETSSASDQGQVELARAIFQVRDATEKAELVAERMVELGEKSQKISRIIGLINEISEQTNLLSLNAAIEAAGAGETGKRFSVVAQEIRRLANRTLESTQLIKELVEEIQGATNAAVMVTEQSMKSSKQAAEIIEKMDESFHHILELVQQTMKAGSEITLSTRQQTTACEQMVSTVMEVSEVAAEVEKGAKETELALGKLGDISANLKRLAEESLDRFEPGSSKVDEDDD